MTRNAISDFNNICLLEATEVIHATIKDDDMRR